MERHRLPRSIRKFIREEKARIRREVLDLQQQEKLITQLYQKFFNQYANKRNIQSGDSKGD